MVSINRLLLNNIRNISQADISLSPGYNFFYGLNGSGKTSILEAIYLLSQGKSFRSHQKSRIIQHQSDEFTLFAELQTTERLTKLGMQKTQTGHTRLQLDGEKCKSMATISELLPVILIDPNSYGLIEDGPGTRRQYLDWGLFHVEHGYANLMVEYLNCLKQRNAALKQHQPLKEITLWDKPLVDLGLKIDRLRVNYLEQLMPYFKSIIEKLDFNVSVQYSYAPGWLGESLQHALEKCIGKDMVMGYTTVGPQRAEVSFTVNNQPAADVLSRGQEKLVVSALMLSQGEFYRINNHDNPIYLIDDLPSELDKQNWCKLLNLLDTMHGQMLMTATDQHYFPEQIENKNNVFHVEHGRVHLL